MRGISWIKRAGLAAVVAVLVVATGASAQNLVVNNSFEDVPGAEWAFYGTTDLDQFSGWFGVNAQDGDWFVGSAIDGGTKTGGVSQQVTVTPGTGYLLTGWVYTWRSNPLMETPLGLIGYDLTGGTDPEAATVVWSEGVYTDAAWVQLGLYLEATGPTVTIFMHMEQRGSGGFNVTAVDNASLAVAEIATISGFVYDTETNALAGATVTADPFLISTMSDLDGSYSLDVPTGTYDATASLPGYNSEIAPGLVVTAAGITQDFYLPEQTCEGFVFDNGGFETAAFPPWTKYGSAGSDFPGPGGWLGGITPYEGDKFWGSAINGGARGTGGVYQHVCVPPGAEVTVVAQSTLYWGTNAPQTADGTRNRLGIDPLGGDNPAGPTVVWTDWDTQENGWTWDWHELTLTTAALGPKVTVFLESYSANEGGDQWHIHGWDGVTFSAGTVEATYGVASSMDPAGPFVDDPAADVTDLGGGVIQADVAVDSQTQTFYQGTVTGASPEPTLEITDIEEIPGDKVRIIYEETP